MFVEVKVVVRAAAVVLMVLKVDLVVTRMVTDKMVAVAVVLPLSRKMLVLS